MRSLQDRIIEYIDEQLDAIARAPGMWGPDLCVELQVLQFLEFRSVTLRPDFEEKTPRAVLDAYNAFLARKFSGTSPSPLAVVLERANRSSELMTILGEFRRELVAQMAPPDLFATHDLVLTLQMRPTVTIPRASALSSYYSAFHSVLRAVTRPAGTRGRASRDIEDAIDFDMPDVRIIPANGAPAQVILPLDQPRAAKAAPVEQALNDIAVINEWAADPKGQVAELRDSFRQDTDRELQRVAAQVLRLMPDEEAEVQTVELGGRLVRRPQPVVIQPSYATRMLEVIKQEDRAPRDFDRVGMVRAVDIDQRSMRIKVEKRSYKCWMASPELVDEARQALGKRVRVMGREYKKSGTSVIIVHQIKP